METKYNEYREGKMISGNEYQDFVCEQMAKKYGISLTIFTSKKYQYSIGESMQGIEIKHDEKRKETGNIYIEVGEKAMPREGEYWPSGIYRSDNTWLYFIGDYEVLYVFSKKQLVKINERKLYSYFVNNNSTNTSSGFLLNKDLADKYCILKVLFN